MRKIITILSIVFGIQLSIAENTREYFLDVNDSKIFVKEMGSGKPLILVHGGPADNHLSFMPYAKELAKNFRVILYDQNDAGQSTSKEDKPHTAYREIETLETIRKHLNINKLSLVGHSWGTILSLMYAEKYPENINKITLISSVGSSFQYYIKFAQNLQSKLTQDDIKKLEELIAKPDMKPSDVLDIYLPYYFYDKSNIEQRTKTDINFKINREILTDISQKFHLDGKESIFNFPIMILQGESDLLTSIDMEEAFKNFKNVEIVNVEKSGHYPFIENPDLITHKLNQFFN